MLVNNFSEAIGNTPLVLINKLNKSSSKIFAKVESMNPLSSIKDRAALFMIEEAEKRGDLKEGFTIVEPTSGNTGVGLAYIAAIKGYKAIFTMPSSMSEERVKLLKAFGAQIVLTDPDKGMSGAIDKANEIIRKNDKSYMPQQFNNSDNSLAHYKTTAPEIYRDLDKKVDIFVSAVGTGGTLSGCAKFFKEKNPNIKIIAVEPTTSAVISHEKSGKHDIQGIGAGFIPKILDTTLIDEVVKISTEESYEMAKAIAKQEGILVGISSGAALSAALKIGIREENREKNIVVIFPDTGERYLSTNLFKED